MPDTQAASATKPAEPNYDGQIKHFVLDTNVLLHNPNALFVFEDNHVVIPYPVIEELDTMKRREDDIGRSARLCIRHLDRLRFLGKLTEGVSWGSLPATQEFNPSSFLANGQAGTIRVDVTDPARPAAIGKDMPDNHIIAVAYALKLAGEPAVFVSKDLSARIKSDALGIKTEDFENQKVDAERLYTGYFDLTVPGQIIDDLYHDKQLDISRLTPYLQTENADGSTTKRDILTNQFVILHDDSDENHTGMARRLAGRLAETDSIIPITGPRKPVYGILARNVQQTMALDLLLDDEIRLVTLLGSAGTGKTLLAIAAGMAKVFLDERFEKLLVARPIMPMGRDIGYLPGDKDEKLFAWMQPIFDNLSYLLSTRGGQHEVPDSHSTEQRIEQLMAGGQLVLEPLTYIRGRSIPHQFMIVDEAQNLTPHEVKTIISRVGEGTKIVLTGDIGQIDNPYLDKASNGLSYAVEQMKNVGIVGHVTLAKSERSELASLASKLL
ncbi:MAG: PhoH family protein [Phycisphaerales bacterium]|nr:PhoH family protein [Phycisphaerales bacterium]MCB9837438.1 PhoH family protein [Phycisphaera sp.]